MSDELVERLRQISQDMRHDARLYDDYVDARTLREAADEIERLSAEVEQLRALITEWVHYSDDPREETLADYDAAWTALRKAVER